MAREVRERCVRLRLRLEKEIERGPLPSRDSGDTTAIGGWGKIGMALEALAAALFDELAAAAHVDPVDARREFGVFRKPTIGQWHEAIIDLARQASRTKEISPSAKLLVADLRKDKMSALQGLADIRNRLQHNVPERPSPKEATQALERGLALLSRVTASP